MAHWQAVSGQFQMIFESNNLMGFEKGEEAAVYKRASSKVLDTLIDPIDHSS